MSSFGITGLRAGGRSRFERDLRHRWDEPEPLWFDANVGDREIPERRLLRAILLQAARDLHGVIWMYKSVWGHKNVAILERNIRIEARRWIMSEESSDEGVHHSFVDICDTLGLDTAKVRRLLVDPEWYRSMPWFQARHPRAAVGDSTEMGMEGA